MYKTKNEWKDFDMAGIINTNVLTQIGIIVRTFRHQKENLQNFLE